MPGPCAGGRRAGGPRRAHAARSCSVPALGLPIFLMLESMRCCIRREYAYKSKLPCKRACMHGCLAAPPEAQSSVHTLQLLTIRAVRRSTLRMCLLDLAFLLCTIVSAGEARPGGQCMSSPSTF